MTPTRSLPTDRRTRAFPWVLATGGAVTALLIMVIFLIWRAGVFVPTLDVDRVVLGDAQSGLFAPEVTVPGVVVDMATTAAPSPEDGSVLQIHFRNGDQVAAGEVVLMLRNSALEREVADNLVRLGREALAIEAQIADLDRRVNDARSQLRDIAFRKRQAVMELERNLVLEQRGFASPARMERLRDEVAFFTEEEINADEVLENTRQDANRRSERLNAAQARLERLSQSIADRLDGLTIRAPADGQISGLTLSVGEPVSSGEVLFTVTRGRPDRISAQVMESAAQDLFVGLEARLRAPHSGDLSIEAIDPQARDGAVEVRLSFLSEVPDDLRAGQMVQIAIQTDEPRTAVSVPFGELVGPDMIWVYDEPNGTATPRPVRLGQRAGARVEVLDGLSGNETILVSAPRPIDGFRSVRIRGAQSNE